MIRPSTPIGDAGVGKTALLRHAIGQAQDMRVLRAVGIETESQLAFAALHQLLRPVLQWLDQESLDALLFPGHRLEAERVALLYAMRNAPDRPVEAAGLPHLHVADLPADAATAMLDASHAMAPRVADDLVRLTGGHPLGLRELPSLLTANQLSGDMPLPDPLPVAGSVEQAFLVQARRLPEAALVLAAADGAGATSTVLQAAASLGCSPDALGQAESAALVHIEADRLTFRHPLVRSAVYSGASFAQRRAAHDAIASVEPSDSVPLRSRGGHPRPIVSDRHAPTKRRRQDVNRPLRADASSAVHRRPAASRRWRLATLLATSKLSS